MVQSGDQPRNGQSGVVTNGASRGRRSSAAAHVLMIPYPMGPHVVPMLGLAERLVSFGDIIVTFVTFQRLLSRVVGDESRMEKLRSIGIHLIGVPDDRPDFNPPSDLVTNPIVLRESLQLGHNIEPFVQSLLQDRELGIEGPTCLVADFIHWWSIDVASRLGIPRYVWSIISNIHVLAVLSWHKNKVDGGSGGADDVPMPGLPPLIRNDMDFPLIGKKNSVLGEQILSRWPKSVTESEGFLLNTCLALDAETMDSMRTLLPEKYPLLAVGPLGFSMDGLQRPDAQVTNWLDQQPPASVLFVSWTTGVTTAGAGNMTERHVLELATGLETSQQRFLWVLRANAGAEALPQGFEERVKGRGLLLRGWAPQKLILAHPSTGGFMSSCGWNSTFESLMEGVPIIGWPVFADQPMTCRYLEVLLKVSIQLPRREDHFVEAEEVIKAIRVLFQSEEGKVLRENAAKVKSRIAEDLVVPGGSSWRALKEFADLILQQHPSTKS